MIRVSVLYPQKQGARFDWSYYLGTHMPMVGRKFRTAAKETSIEQGIGGAAPGMPAPYVAIAHFIFDSAEGFQAAFASLAQEIVTDILNDTSIEPVIQMSEIRTQKT